LVRNVHVNGYFAAAKRKQGIVTKSRLEELSGAMSTLSMPASKGVALELLLVTHVALFYEGKVLQSVDHGGWFTIFVFSLVLIIANCWYRDRFDFPCLEGFGYIDLVCYACLDR